MMEEVYSWIFFYTKINLSGSVLFYLDYLVYSLINCTDDIPS